MFMGEQLDEPLWRSGDDWDELPQWGDLLAKRYAAGLPPMHDWAWYHPDDVEGWVGLKFTGDLWDMPFGAGAYLRPRDGAVVLIGSGAFDWDLVDVIAGLPPDAPPAVINAEIDRRFKAQRARTDYYNSP